MLSFFYLRNAKQLNLKDESGTSWYAWLRKLAITHFGRDIYLPFIAHTHLLHGNNPTFNEVTETYGQWSTATAAVKLFAVDGTACVMGSDNASRRRMLSISPALSQHLVINALGESLHSLLLRLCCKPILVGLCVFSFIHVHTLFVRR